MNVHQKIRRKIELDFINQDFESNIRLYIHHDSPTLSRRPSVYIHDSDIDVDKHMNRANKNVQMISSTRIM